MTSEEASCETSDQICMFDVQTPSATVTSLTPEYDTASKAYQIVIDGTGFPSDSSDGIELYIDGFLQTIVSFTADKLVFELVNILDTTSSNV